MVDLPAIDLSLLALSFSLAIALALLLTPVVRQWALAHGVVSLPRDDRWHQQPTPLLGGVAIFVAAMCVIVSFSQIDTRLLGLVAGGTLLFATGLVDDLRRMPPHAKLVVQILAACALIVGGVRIEIAVLAPVAIPLTILWVVGITNAFNLLDNMDGLSAGTAAIAAAFLVAFSLSTGTIGTAILSGAVAGAALGFLVYNFNPARIFMGDSGSMFLGFMLSGIALIGTHEMASDIFFVLLVPAAIMGLPIFDTTLVTILRTIEGRPLAQGGRDHLSHRLVALGLSERQAVLLLYAFAGGFGSLGLLARSIGLWTSLVVAGVLLVAAVLFGAYLGQIRLYGPSQYEAVSRSTRLADRPIVNGMILFKREIGLVTLDLALVCLAYLGAYVLRFGVQESLAQPTWPSLFSETLPFVVVVKLTVLLTSHAYRGMMRYVGVSDLLTFVRATFVSSLVLVFVLPVLFRHEAFPRSVLVIDCLLFTSLLVGSRLSFAALTDTFARLQSQRVPRVLIVGAGDLGELILRSLIRSGRSAYQTVGFLDQDLDKRNRAIHGVPVIGALEDFERTVAERDVDLVVLALSPTERPAAREIRERCEVASIPVVDAAQFLEGHFTDTLPERVRTEAREPGSGSVVS